MPLDPMTPGLRYPKCGLPLQPDFRSAIHSLTLRSSRPSTMSWNLRMSNFGPSSVSALRRSSSVGKIEKKRLGAQFGVAGRGGSGSLWALAKEG